MKAKLRETSKQARATIVNEEHIRKSNQIVERLLPLLSDKKMIGIYIPIQNEVDVTSLLFLYSSVGVPKVRNNKDLDFFLIHNVNDLEKGNFNILEPNTNVWISPNDFDCIIVPMVAFDQNCNRIGYGKGYYDRYLKQSKAYTIGVAFDIQRVDEIPVDENDYTLDCVVTESKIYKNKT